MTVTTTVAMAVDTAVDTGEVVTTTIRTKAAADTTVTETTTIVAMAIIAGTMTHEIAARNRAINHAMIEMTIGAGTIEMIEAIVVDVTMIEAAIEAAIEADEMVEEVATEAIGIDEAVLI